MFCFDKMFDFNGDGKLDVFESAMQFHVLDAICRDETEETDESDVFADAGLDYDDLEMMDPGERRGVLEDAGLNPDEFDF